MIPQVTKLTEIPSAMEALEKFLTQEVKDETGLMNLNTHAKRMSARAVVEAYKNEQPQSKEDFIQFFKKLPHRYSRVGFTGEPHSEVNTLLSQIAWACEPNSLPMFWKILYPEANGVIDGGSNSQWPRYGEAILSESLAQKSPGPILNYRKIWKQAETAPIALIEEIKVSAFCPAHRDYWLEVVDRRKNKSRDYTVHQGVFKTEFKNYYEFFDSMCAFMETYTSRKNIHWEDDIGSTPEGLQAMLDFRAYQEIILNAPKILQAIFGSIAQLPGVLKSIAGEKIDDKVITHVDRSCFRKNSEVLRKILNNEEVKKTLSEVEFASKSNALLEKENAPINGHDALFYLPEHTRQLGALSEDSFIELIRRHEVYGLALNVLADLYRPLLEQSDCMLQKLFNTVYQLDDPSLENRLSRLLLGETLDMNSKVKNLKDYFYGLLLLERRKYAPERMSNKAIVNYIDQFKPIFEKRFAFIENALLEFNQINNNALDSVIQLVENFSPSVMDFLYMEKITNKLRRSFQGESWDLHHSFRTSAVLSEKSGVKYPDRAVRKYAIENLIKFSRMYSGENTHEEKLMGLVARVTSPCADIDLYEQTKRILALYKHYQRLPRLRNQLLKSLTNESLCHYLLKYDVFVMDAIHIISERNYFTSIEKMFSIVQSFQQSVDYDQLRHPMVEWLKSRSLSIEDIGSLISHTRIYRFDRDMDWSRLLRLLISKGDLPIRSHADFLKLTLFLREDERSDLCLGYPLMKSGLTQAPEDHFSKIIELGLVDELLLTALDLNDSTLGAEHFLKYFENAFSSLSKKSEKSIEKIFVKMTEVFGRDQTIPPFTRLLAAHLNENPDEILEFLIRSSHWNALMPSVEALEIALDIIPKKLIIDLMCRNPTHKKNIIEHTLRNFDHLSDREQEVFQTYFRILTQEEMTLFFEKGLSVKTLLNMTTSLIGFIYPDFRITLFHAIPMRYLREHPVFLIHILDHRLVDMLRVVLDAIVNTDKFAEIKDFFMKMADNHESTETRMLASFIRRNYTEKPLIISSRGKVSTIENDSEADQNPVRRSTTAPQ
jgi:hypothetical protein